MENSSKRIEAFDIAKGIGILLVVIGHSFTEGEISKFIYSFHMALFFVVSGLFLNEDNKKTKDRKSAMKLFLSNNLMAAYVLWSSVYVMFNIAVRLAILHEIGNAEIVWAVYRTVILYGIGVLWFLPNLLISKAIISKVNKIIKPKFPCLVAVSAVAILGILLAPYIEMLNQAGAIKLIYYPLSVLLRSIVMAYFICIGYISKPYIFKIRNFNRGAILTLGLFLLVITWMISQSTIGVDIHSLQFGNPFEFIVLGTVGSYGILFSSIGLENVDKVCKAFKFLGSNSLLIMVTHENLKIKTMLNCMVSAVGLKPTQPEAKILVMGLLMLIEVIICNTIGAPVDRITKKIKENLGVIR